MCLFSAPFLWPLWHRCRNMLDHLHQRHARMAPNACARRNDRESEISASNGPWASAASNNVPTGTRRIAAVLTRRPIEIKSAEDDDNYRRGCDAAAAPDEPTAAAPASPSTEEAMSQQVRARGDDCDQHQLLECLRRNFIAHMLSDAHAERDWQHRNRRD